MKDLGIISNYLGIAVNYNEEDGTISLNKTNYLKNILQSHVIAEYKPANFPYYEENLKPEDKIFLEKKCERSPEAPPICGFVNANWAGDTRERKSTLGFTLKRLLRRLRNFVIYYLPQLNSDSRILRDERDVQKLVDWFSSHGPFPSCEHLMSISSGIVAHGASQEAEIDIMMEEVISVEVDLLEKECEPVEMEECNSEQTDI
ncbi:hypothetical protein ILUMI_04472 [Ignelater luminosus]|uniref:Uncharacterized protein n=1 Tax=Ignelater luminosus TaxID=2038154 RepID=A0A8K0GJJ9_IGNLU|nr:hypothetical protein ILUMI_04472 [Ignelater luminosus]